jgi:Holliday junction resolvasome RuvABC ATP-dependent DNA helicase subunit
LRRAAAERQLARQTQGFASIVGQGAAIQRLKEFAALYSQSGNPPGHILLTGVEGIGKRTIARAFAAEYCEKYAEADGKQLARGGDLMGILTNLAEGDALLVADIAKTPKKVADFFVRCLREFTVDLVVDKGMFARRIDVKLKRFTCLATARSKAECPPQFIEAFPLVLPLQSYSQAELVSVCEQVVQRKGVAITRAAAVMLAGPSVGTPHDIEVLVDRLAGLGRTTISQEDVAQVSSVLGLSSRSVNSASASDMDTLSGVDFEKLVATLLQGMGFHTEMTEIAGDGGIDIVATLDQPLIGGRYLIQCKRFAPDKLVGAAAVRDFYGALTADRRAIKGILITTSGFTGQALAFAGGLPIELIDGQRLGHLLAQYRISAAPENTSRALFE